MPKLTETFARDVIQVETGTAKYWDTEVKGLGLFVGMRAKTWYYQKDVGGETKRILVGRYPAISARAARQTALGFALEWGRGAGKRIAFDAPALGEAMNAYLARPRLRSVAHRAAVRQQFELHLKDWMRLPLDEITKADVVRRHAALARTPSNANHLLKYFRTVWNHSRRTHDLPESPTIAIEWFAERPDGDIIEDLRGWRRRIDGLDNPVHRAFFELLLYTGLRKTEALTLEWKNVHSDHLHLTMTKNGRPFDLPILPLHHAMLDPLKGLHRKWVFPSPKGPEGRLSAPTRLGWSPHAHRRTFATVAVEAGVLEEIVGRLLNHTPLSVTGQRYAKPSLEALRPHMDTVCAALLTRSASRSTMPASR